MIVLLYIKDKPIRDYGVFNSHPNDTSRPIPSIQWDSMITNVYRLSQIREVHLVNYKLINNMPHASDNMVTVLMLFAEVNHDVVDIVVEDRIMPFDMRPRIGYKAYKQVTKV